MSCVCMYVVYVCFAYVYMLCVYVVCSCICCTFMRMYIYIVRLCGCMHFMRMSYVLDMDKYPSLGSASLDMSDGDGVCFLIQNMNNR